MQGEKHSKALLHPCGMSPCPPSTLTPAAPRALGFCRREHSDMKRALLFSFLVLSQHNIN